MIPADTDTVSVIFYGLFMDHQRLTEKGIKASDPRLAWVADYRLSIGQRATLLPAAGFRAHGVVVSLSQIDLDRLYADPSVADYVAETVSAVYEGGESQLARCYNLPESRLTGSNPEYARALLQLAEQLGLPSDYLGQIRQFLA